jgi:hypothetical protein
MRRPWPTRGCCGIGKKNTVHSSSYVPTGRGSPEGAGLYQGNRENLCNLASSAWFLLLSSIIIIIIVVVVVVVMNKM